MTSPIQSKGVPLSSIFDPYVAGTTKARASGINDAGNDTSNMYANIIYGSAAPATGIESEGADLNTLYAKIGTASYALPIDGQKFTIAGIAPAGQSASASLSFSINTSGWSVVASSTSVSPTTKASGSVPSGAVSIQITDTWLDAPGDTDAGTVNNTCSTYTAIPSSGTIGDGVVQSGSDTSGQTSHQLVILMKNAAGTVISSTTCQFVCVTSTG